MKFNFRKISAIGASVLMAGMTMGVAAAAAYPNPFVVGGTADVAIVYGTGAGVSAIDVVSAGNIQSNLQSYMGSSGGSSTTVSGNAASLASGSDELYLNDDLAENVQTLTKADLPIVLADGEFTDDSGTDYDYEQKITLGTSTDNGFAFGNSDNDLDNPALMLELYSGSTVSTNYAYEWTVTFGEAVNFTHSDSEGEELSIFGKTYTVGTATDSDTLVLLGGSSSTRIDVGETKTLTIGEESYEVTLNAISDATNAVASISVDGETKTFTEGQTKDIKGNDVYVKTVFRTGDNSGYVEVQLGADKLTFENASEVQYGSDNEDIDGTYVSWTANPDAMTDLSIAVAAEDSDVDHFLVGEAFTDPVFGTVKLEFASVVNGPTFTEEQDTGRNAIKILSGGDRELLLEITDKAGNTASGIPFIYQDTLQDDASNTISLVEGATISEDGYFILNSGDNQHIMQLTKADFGDGTNDDVKIEDVITGNTYSFDNHNFASGYSATILGQTYTITNQSESSATITSSDYSTNVAVYPYLELVSGEDYPRVAITDVAQVFTGATKDSDKALDLPTGSVDVAFTNSTTKDCSITFTGTGVTSITLDNSSTVDTLKVGEVYYYVNYTDTVDDDEKCTAVNVTMAVNPSFSDTDEAQASPGILFVEGEDNSESSSDVYNAIFFNMTDDTNYGEFNNVKFSSTVNTQYDTQSWDDTDYTGYLTNWGSYVLSDSSDSDQHLASITYPEDQMYAEVYLAESGATITGGTTTSGTTQLGEVLYKDTETSQYSNKNVIVVGGSCINSAAAALVGEPACGARFTELTGVGSGQFLIKGYASSSVTSKVALLVAGYNVDDTSNAAKALTTQSIDTSKEYTGTTSSSVTLVTEESS